MDEDLLDRYFASQCTPEEAASVRRWLEKPVANEKKLLRRSWHSIQKHIRTSVVRQFHPFTKYFAAAAVIFLTLSDIGWKLLPQHLELKNNSGKYEAFNTSGLRLTLPPQASVRVSHGIASHSADLIFCGGARIQNNSANDVEMKLNLKCMSGNPVNYTTTLIVRKEKKYLAFQYHFKSDEVIVVEEDRLFDLPLPLQQKALEALEI